VRPATLSYPSGGEEGLFGVLVIAAQAGTQASSEVCHSRESGNPEIIEDTGFRITFCMCGVTK